jgi:hypothetical protein
MTYLSVEEIDVIILLVNCDLLDVISLLRVADAKTLCITTFRNDNQHNDSKGVEH